MDEFAQTRGVDDLFDDDIVPVTATAEEVVEEHTPYRDVQQPWEAQVRPQSQSPSQGQGQGQQNERYQETQQAETKMETQHGGLGGGLNDSIYANAQDEEGTQQPTGEYRKRGGRGRGRGRGRRGRGARSNAGDSVKVESVEKGVQKVIETEETEQQQQEHDTEQTNSTDAREEGTDIAAAAEADDSPKSKTTEDKQEKIFAVRGDRSGTGGVRKPKLTEDELTARITAAKRTAAKRAEAHARASADEASFFERERIAKEKAKQEAVNRRVLANEREANRMRKLKAQGGREWDAEKGEESGRDAFGEGRRGGRFRRGMYGGVGGDVARNDASASANANENGNAGGDGGGATAEEWDSARGNGGGFRGRGRGRGGRGRGRGRGRGGGGGSNNNNGWGGDPNTIVTDQDKLEAAPFNAAATDFPALPGGKDENGIAPKTTKTRPAMPSWDTNSPIESKGTWADQMEPASPAIQNQK